ncbi:MAG TPA: hypothetical protein PKA88_23510, partial [Polyangiaceae bacterium]|nr:hypothetical protein [Polyangiaceae bacterium]
MLNSKCSSSFVVSGADSGPFDIAVKNSLTGNSYIYNDVVADAANTVQLHLPDGGSIRCSFDGVPDAVLNALKRGSEPMLIVYDSDGFCCCSAWLGDPEFRGKSSVVVRGLKDGIYTCVAAAGNEWMSVPITAIVSGSVETEVRIRLARTSKVEVRVSEEPVIYSYKLYVDGSSA